MGYTYASVPTLDVDNYQEIERRKIRYSVVGGIALFLIVSFIIFATVTPLFGSKNSVNNATYTNSSINHPRSARSRLWLPDGLPAVVAFLNKGKNHSMAVHPKKPPSTTNLLAMLPPGGLSYLPLAMKTFGKVMAAKKRVLAGTSGKCSAQLDELLNRLINSRGQSTWALQFFDALGKPPAGIIEGNPWWSGSRDECAEIVPHIDSKGRERFGGRYCLASIGKYQTHTLEPSHPQLPVGVNVGFCMPRACSQQDFVTALSQLLQEVGAGSNLTSKNSTVVNWSYCETTPEEWRLDAPAITVLTVIAVFVMLVVFGTLQEVLLQYRYAQAAYSVTKTPESNNNTNAAHCDVTELAHSKFTRFLLSFSMLTNGTKILSSTKSSTAAADSGPQRITLHSLHGIRVFTMTWIILTHTYIFSPYLYGDVFRGMRIITESFWFQIILNGHLAVDTFFVLSGALLVYIFLYETDKRNGRGVPWFQYYFLRFWRLTPAMAVSIGILAGLMPLFLVGPNSYFNEIMAPQRCSQAWWTNLLYVNNLFKFDQQCAPWTWYLACDTQFYVLAPLVLVPLVRRGTRAGMTVLGGLMVGHLIASFGVTMYRDAPMEIFGNMLMQDYKQLWNYYGWYYMQPWGRAGPYLIGMLLGLLLYKWQQKVSSPSAPPNVPWWFLTCGWTLLPVFTLVPLFFTYPMYQQKGPYPTWINAFYNTFARSFWALGVSWVVFACETGYGSFVNTVLSWQALIPLSRLTYCAYLLHVPLLSFLTAAAMAPVPFSYTITTIRFGGLWLVTYLAAFVFSCVFEAPMVELAKALWGNGRTKQRTNVSDAVSRPHTIKPSFLAASTGRGEADSGDAKAGNVPLKTMTN